MSFAVRQRFLGSACSRLMAVGALSLALTGAGRAIEPTAEKAPAEKAPAAQATTAPTFEPKAKAIVDRSVEVTGGRDAWTKNKAMETRATIEVVGRNITGTEVRKTSSPDKMLMVVDLGQAGVQEQGYIDGVGWSRDAMNGLRLVEGKELELYKFQASAEESALEPEKVYTSMKYVAETTFDGKAVDEIELVGAIGKMTSYFDKATGFMVGVKMTISGQMGEMEITTTMSDYKEVGGVKIPHTTVADIGGMAQLKTTVTELKVNPEFSADTFKVPAEVQELVKNKK